MISYLVRRLLLFVPTLLGATVVIFMLMALAPISIIDVLLPRDGSMQPGDRARREEYIQERYGLNKPASVQYLRWLNNISPLGFHKWKRDDPEVIAAKTAEARQRTARSAQLVAAGTSKEDAEATAKNEIDIGPDAGEVRINRPTVKWPDLGYSFVQSRPSVERIKEALPVTLVLQLLSLPVALAIAVFTGIQAARFRGRFWDRAVGTLLLALYAIPVIWIGAMMVGFLANDAYIRWFPSGGIRSSFPIPESQPFLPSTGPDGVYRRGILLDSLWHVVLPVICLSYTTIAYYSKLTRTALLETLGMDFVRTARAKGLPEKVVLYRHAFRNSLIPLITVAASFLPQLVVGSVVVEYIFDINGMGRLAVMALKAKDQELFLSVSVIILLLQLAANLAADVLYTVADPRVTFDR